MNLQHPTEPPPDPSRRWGEMTRFGGLSDRGVGYMAASERVGPSVVVIPDAYGLTEGVRELADRLVREGFTVLAVDLFERRVATGEGEAQALRATLRGEAAERTAMKRLRAAVAHLSDNWHPRVGVVGFGLGADLAARLATEVDLDLTVAFYGGEAAAITAGPALVHLSGRDPAAAAAARACAEVDDVEVLLWDAAPGFATAGSPAFDETTAETAVAATVAELTYYLS